MVLRAVVVIGVLLVSPACPNEGDDRLSLPPPPASELLSCGSGPSFPPSALSGPPAVGDSPAAEALRANRKGFPLPPGDHQWRTLGTSETEVLFGAGDPAKGTDSLGAFDYALVERHADGWEVSGSGGCVPRPIRPGLRGADWEPEGPVAPAASRFVATVVEQSCTGGASSNGRIYPADVRYQPDAVVVTFWVKPLPAGFYNCQGNPPTRYEVTLREALGNRQLLNGGVYPPRTPSLHP